MKTKILTVAVTALLCMAAITSCNNNKRTTWTSDPAVVAADNPRNSLDYEGTYAGTMPCADCPGIYTEITLSGDNYRMKQVYEGVQDANNTYEISGTYTWDPTGRIIALHGDSIQQYQVGENALYFLDQYGTRITGDLAEHYILVKNDLYHQTILFRQKRISGSYYCIIYYIDKV